MSGLTVEEYYQRLKAIQEPKGNYFNADLKVTFELLEGLLANKERYGYMSCPCRLASGDREVDQDIICPCAYREQGIAEYGSCYCNLYVSGSWNESDEHHPVVPERRPPERMF